MATSARHAAAIPATIPVVLEVPSAMVAAVQEVLAGEYECSLSGEGLVILDLGANMGAFSHWAHLRWPGSTIHAYEPYPGTFEILQRNLNRLTNARAYNVAVHPTRAKKVSLCARFAGDGEASLLKYAKTTFSCLEDVNTVEVSALHPGRLPSADIVKLDVEGGEDEILGAMDLTGTSLVVLEYHRDASRTAIKHRLESDFSIEFEDAYAWDRLMDKPSYRSDLQGDHYGRLFFANRNLNKLSRMS